MDCRETLISRGDPAAASLFQIQEESLGACRRDVVHSKSLDPAMGGTSDKWQELL
jgi:hypothetical protein